MTQLKTMKHFEPSTIGRQTTEMMVKILTCAVCKKDYEQAIETIFANPFMAAVASIVITDICSKKCFEEFYEDKHVLNYRDNHELD